MKLPLPSLALLLVLPLVGACTQRQDTTATTTTTTTANVSATDGQPQTMLGKTVAGAIDKARRELETSNIDIGDGTHIQLGGSHRIEIGKADAKLPKAEITPTGDLLIAGKPQPLTAVQRTQLLAYRGEVIKVAETGMRIGAKGADLAGKALGEIVSGALHGDMDAAGKRIDAEGKKLEAEAKVICAQLPGMLTTQQQLAASLPAFRPYARMSQADVDDCMDHDHAGVAVTSNE